MDQKDFIKSETHLKFINLMCKFRNNYHMDSVVGMKKSEFLMLITVDSTITKTGTATVSQISSAMKITNAAASKTIGVLEDDGYIIKKVNKDDKRQANIELTENGKQKLTLIKIEMDEFTESVFAKFGDDNADKLLELIEKMYEITSEEIKIRMDKKIK